MIEFSIRSFPKFEEMDGEPRKLITGKISLEDAIFQIKQGHWQSKLQQYYHACSLAKNRKDIKKEKYLPAIFPSMCLSKFVKMSYWDGTETMTGLFHFDIDGNFDVQEVRKELLKACDPVYMFSSPNGGLKFAVMTDEVDPARFKLVWKGLAHSFDKVLKPFNLECDKKVNALNSQCYMSYDPNAYINENCELFDTAQFKQVDKKLSQSIIKPVVLSGNVAQSYKKNVLRGIQKRCSNLDRDSRWCILTCAKKFGFDEFNACQIVDSVGTINQTTKGPYLWGQADINFFDDTTAYMILKKYSGVSPPSVIPKPTVNQQSQTFILDNSKSEKLDQVWNQINFKKTNILNSPTNSGKTYGFVHSAQDKRLMIAPYRAIVEQTTDNHKEVTGWYGNSPWQGGDCVVGTYDKLKRWKELFYVDLDPTEYNLFIDEAHLLYTAFNYRKDAVLAVYDALTQFKSCTLMSGTFNSEFIDLSIDERIKVEWKGNIQRTCKVVFTEAREDWLLNNLKVENGKTIIWYENKDGCAALSELLEENGFICQVFHSENRDDWENRRIIQDEEINAVTDVLIMTSVGVAGLNLLNTNIDRVIAYDFSYSSDLVQLHNRARLCNPELITFRKPATDDGYNTDIDVDGMMQYAKRFIAQYNPALKQCDESMREAFFNTISQTIGVSGVDDKALRYLIDTRDGNLAFCDLGLAALQYEAHKRNEYRNLEFFESNLAIYGYCVEWNIEDVEPSFKLDKSKQKRRKKTDICFEILEIMRKYKNEIEVNDYIASISRQKWDEHPAAQILRKLLHYYEYKDVLRFASNSRQVDKAMDYAEDKAKGNLMRELMEKQFCEGDTYTSKEVVDVFVQDINPVLRRSGFERLPVDERACVAKLNRLFAVEKAASNRAKVRRVGGKKVNIYPIKSFNPTGYKLKK